MGRGSALATGVPSENACFGFTDDGLAAKFFGALGVAAMGMLYPVAYHWLRRAPLALIATMFTSVIHTVWWHSTIVENYMVNAVLLLANLLPAWGHNEYGARSRERNTNSCRQVLLLLFQLG